MLALLVHYVHRATVETDQAPAIWALLAAGLVLFSLSYAIWKADIVLMYCMWLALVFSPFPPGMNDRWPIGLRIPATCPCGSFFGVAAFTCYAVDYLFLARR